MAKLSMTVYTNAPEAYDYGYVETQAVVGETKKGLNAGSPVRRIRVTDSRRFETFQVPRYQSGLYLVWFTISDLREAVELGIVGRREGS